jgi:hypothetical protein
MDLVDPEQVLQQKQCRPPAQVSASLAEKQEAEVAAAKLPPDDSTLYTWCVLVLAHPIELSGRSLRPFCRRLCVLCCLFKIRECAHST